MTSHELARQLLNGPDLPIMVPKVKEYSDDDEDCCAEPHIGKREGYNFETGWPCEVLVVSYKDTPSAEPEDVKP